MSSGRFSAYFCAFDPVSRPTTRKYFAATSLCTAHVNEP